MKKEKLRGSSEDKAKLFSSMGEVVEFLHRDGRRTAREALRVADNALLGLELAETMVALGPLLAWARAIKNASMIDEEGIVKPVLQRAERANRKTMLLTLEEERAPQFGPFVDLLKATDNLGQAAKVVLVQLLPFVEALDEVEQLLAAYPWIEGKLPHHKNGGWGKWKQARQYWVSFAQVAAGRVPLSANELEALEQFMAGKAGTLEPDADFNNWTNMNQRLKKDLIPFLKDLPVPR